MFNKRIKHAAALALLGVTTACGDLGPTGPSFANDLTLMAASELKLQDGRLALTWIDPLEESVSVTRTVGRWGGLIEMGTPGLRLWIPPFALDDDLEITMSARQGEDVAFDFQPHGTQFNYDIWVSIDLTKVLDGNVLIEQLTQCSEATAESGQTSAGAKGKKGGSSWSWRGGKSGKKNSGSDGATQTDTTGTDCSFSWLERVNGLDGVYLDPNFSGTGAQALQDFEVWVFMNRWLTFKTDHFSGYALAM